MSKKISIVIPAYNEEESIKPLYQEITQVLSSLNNDYEIIFVDDGSTDNTYQNINDLHLLDHRVQCIRLRKNFGKSLALSVGFEQSSGEIIITMDADLQDDPREIPRFLDKLDEGWDLVSGWKKVRKDSVEKRVVSKIFNIVVSKISKLKLHDFNCGFKAYRKQVIETIEIYGELHRFIPMIANSYGFRICEIPVAHHKRKFGKTKFGVERYLAGLLDLSTTFFITRYLSKPLHFLGKLSLAFFMPGVILLGYVFVIKFIFGQSGNRPALTIAVFLLGISVQIFLFGLLADLLSYTNQKHNFRTKDFIRDKLFKKS